MKGKGPQSVWRVRLWLYAPLVFWIGVIFFLSSPQGSMNETSRIIGPILHLLFPAISPETEGLVHFYVRKAAHLTEYAILGVLACRAFVKSSYWPAIAI